LKESRVDEQLKEELEKMFESDQENRLKMWEVVQKEGQDSPLFLELALKQKENDKANIERLVEIIEHHGWPGLGMVGEKASNGAFLVLQHADLPLQEKFLPMLREAKEAGEMKGEVVALLEDRVLMRQGKKQIYGSQITTNAEGLAEPWPIEDEPNVDKRRAALGMEPMAAYMRHIGVEYVPKQGP
jgi:hypothetical protein